MLAFILSDCQYIDNLCIEVYVFVLSCNALYIAVHEYSVLSCVIENHIVGFMLG